MIGSNLDPCRRGPPLIKLIGYEYREDALGLGGAGNDKHTHTHIVPRDTQGGWSLEKGSDANLIHVSMARPLFKLIGYDHREDSVGGVGARNGKHTHKHTVSLFSPSRYTLWIGPRAMIRSDVDTCKRGPY